MTLLHRLTSELHRLGSSGHPIARTLPHILSEYRRWRMLTTVAVLLSGVVLGSGGSLWVIWQRLDAITGTAEKLALACMNPGKVAVTTKEQSRVIVSHAERKP